MLELDFLPLQFDLTRRSRDGSAGDFQKGRFSGTIFPNQGVNLGLEYVQIHALKRVDAGVDLYDPAQAHDRGFVATFHGGS
jgi:hypothetical protein